MTEPDRAERAFRDAITELDLPPAPDPAATRRHVRDRRLATLAVVATVLIVAVVGGFAWRDQTAPAPAVAQPAPAQTSPSTDPAPAGWRSEHYRDIRFEVPASWGYAQPPDSSWCADDPRGVLRPEQRTPYVWLDMDYPIRTIGCPEMPSTLQSEHVEARVPVGPLTEPRVGIKLAARRAPDTAAVAFVVPADDRPLVVSDIDDTVLITGVKERLKMVGRTLVGDPTDRQVVDGMPDLLRGLAAGAPVFYVSTSPWNLYQRLADTLAHHHVPAGPLLLTDWGFGRKQMLVRPALEYKVETITGLLADFPGREAVLVGDSGQHDLAAYLAVAEAQEHATYPHRVPHCAVCDWRVRCEAQIKPRPVYHPQRRVQRCECALLSSLP